MMKKLTFLLLSGLLFGWAEAQKSPEQDFEKANAFYQKAQYDSAQMRYQTWADSLYAPEFCYNLANTYFQEKKWAEAVYYYEKTLKIDPAHSDALHNLQVVQSQLADDFATQEVFPVQISKRLLALVLPKTWYFIALFFACAALLSALWFVFFCKTPFWRKLALGKVFTQTLLALLFLWIAQKSSQNLQDPQWVIIFENNATLYAEPSSNSPVVHQLHEGTKLLYMQENAQYFEVRTPIGTQGWLLKQYAKVL